VPINPVSSIESRQNCAESIKMRIIFEIVKLIELDTYRMQRLFLGVAVLSLGYFH
jgi:hypothetical protein